MSKPLAQSSNMPGGNFNGNSEPDSYMPGMNDEGQDPNRMDVLFSLTIFSTQPYTIPKIHNSIMKTDTLTFYLAGHPTETWLRSSQQHPIFTKKFQP